MCAHVQFYYLFLCFNLYIHEKYNTNLIQWIQFNSNNTMCCLAAKLCKKHEMSLKTRSWRTKCRLQYNIEPPFHLSFNITVCSSFDSADKQKRWINGIGMHWIFSTNVNDFLRGYRSFVTENIHFLCPTTVVLKIANQNILKFPYIRRKLNCFTDFNKENFFLLSLFFFL